MVGSNEEGKDEVTVKKIETRKRSIYMYMHYTRTPTMA